MVLILKLLLPLTVAVAGGCQRSDLPPMAPAKGVVRLDGRPLGNVSVALTPKSGGRASQGVSESDGTFPLSTFVLGDGALVGAHVVTVSPMEPVPVAYTINPQSVPSYKPPFPSRYWTPTQSGLEVKIEAGKQNEVVLELTSDPNL